METGSSATLISDMAELKKQIDQDLKSAMLARDSQLVTTLRGLKSAILYAEVAAGKREQGLDEGELVSLLQKEAKKRQESADLYAQGGNKEKEQAELAEKEVIEGYLPKQLTDEELRQVVNRVVDTINEEGPSALGRAIGQVKKEVGARADGARIAQIVKEELAK